MRRATGLSITLATLLAGCAQTQVAPPAPPPTPAAAPPAGMSGTGIYPAGPGAQAQAGPPPGPGAMPRGPRPPDHIARGPSMMAALTIARTAVLSCKGQHVGVTVLDAEGGIKLTYIADGTGAGHAYTGYRKALTAVRFDMPSEQAAKAADTDPALKTRLAADQNYIPWAGGVPLKVGGELIGAVGVSGAEPSEKDKACAIAGIAAARRLLR